MTQPWKVPILTISFLVGVGQPHTINGIILAYSLKTYNILYYLYYAHNIYYKCKLISQNLDIVGKHHGCGR